MYDGDISIETYSAGAGGDVASMVDNEQLKCTATLPLYITLGSTHSRTFFWAFATLTLWKEIQNFGCPCCNTCQDLSIDVSITDEGQILTKLRWSQLFSTQNKSSNSVSNFFEKKIQFLGFHAVVLLKTFPLIYQLLMKDWY